MPLPAALAARLQRRGLLPANNETKHATSLSTSVQNNEEVEEVFAEDYDDPLKSDPVLPEPATELHQQQQQHQLPDGADVDEEFYTKREVPACPNRWNPYHECTAYCKQRWGIKTWNPDDNMIRKRDRMLRKYPLPPEWQEVADPETDRYYYWNTQTDQVSWLSPIHPKAVITLSAEKLQAVLRTDDKVESESDESEEEGMDVSESDSSSLSSSDEEEYDRRHEKGRFARERNRGGGLSGRRKDDIDPMDPAAYSDIPRGGWSAGLERSGDAKTGVDSTASGPLFQQRPYPSPGAVLRANRGAKS